MLLKNFIGGLVRREEGVKLVIAGMKLFTAKKRAGKAAVRTVAVESLRMSKPMTRQDIAARYKAGRISEIS